jgi:hypothetical protein
VAQKLYKTTFNWILTPAPELDYTLISIVEIGENNMPKEHGAINGVMMQCSNAFNCPIPTIDVEDIDEALKKSRA